MAEYQKIRILVGNEKRLAEFFSLKESKKDGTVTIIPKSGYRMTIDEDRSKIKTEHISIHPSLSSPTKGTTIKTTIVLEDENKGDEDEEENEDEDENSEKNITQVAFIENSRENLVWPIYTKCTADLTNDDYHYTYNRESEIKKIIADKIDPHFLILYSVVVQRKNGIFPEIENFSLEFFKFKEFVVGVYFTYLHIPPTLTSYRTSLFTSPMKINGLINNHNQKTGRAISYTVDHLKDLLYVYCERVARNQTRFLIQDFLRDPIYLPPVIVDLLSDDCSIISKNPSSQYDEKKLDYLYFICDLMKVDDSYEFKKALNAITKGRDFAFSLIESLSLFKSISNGSKHVVFGKGIFAD